MIYITTRQQPRLKQMTLQDLLFETNYKPALINASGTNTRTVRVESLTGVSLNVKPAIDALIAFNDKYRHLKEVDDWKSAHYHTFYLPKKSGGLRCINAPEPELKQALSELKDIFEITCGALYHTSAFAYIKGRSTIEALKRHQKNESHWYAKLDLAKFFDSVTMEFALHMLSMIYPFSEILSWDDGRKALTDAISLGFLDGGLPQGTPLSPTLTNVIMIPIDYEFNSAMRKYDQQFVCTRYADDFLISSRKDFKVKNVENTLSRVLKEFDAPLKINHEKTRYGSRAGQNWNLGLMINANNEITVGHKRKREFKAMLSNYIQDSKNGKIWDLGDVQTLEGLRSYYTSVERGTIDEIITNLNNKYGVDVKQMIKIQLHG